MVHKAAAKFAGAGDNVDISVLGLEPSVFRIGSILCDPEQPTRAASKFKAQIAVFSLEVPITRGFPVLLHSQSMNEPATISRLLGLLDPSTGEIKQRRPRCLNERVTASVEIETQHPVCLELFRDFKQLGRFMLRYSGRTIAAGIVTEM